METILLNNGKTLPLEGFGVFQIADQTLCQQAVLEALQEGYRLIDTAASYFNEEAVGRALRTSSLPRDEVFVTTKVWVQDFGEVKTRDAVLRSLEKLGLEYIDMVLLHQQMGDYYGAWRALEALVQEGIIGTIGVSNFYPDRLADLCCNAAIPPAVNQIECHPFYQRRYDLQVMKSLGVVPMAWGPLAERGHGIWTHPTLEAIGKKHGELSSEVQHFSRGGKSEALSGSVIEHIHDLGNFLLGHLLEVGASREKLTYQAIQVLYRRLLPRGMGTSEIEGDPQGFLHFLITGKFFSPIPGHGFQWELPVLKQEPKSPHGLLGRAAS